MSQDRGNFKGRRNHGHSHNKNRKQINVGDKGKEVLEKINENSPVIKQFQKYATDLDAKHDRYERLVKISRDITIESKRIIFLLHTLDKESKKNTVLGEAEKRLNSLMTVMFKNIAQELDGEDSYHYLRAYRAGLQEFVEAITFYWYLQNSTLYNWSKLEESFTYTISNSSETEKTETPSEAQTPAEAQALTEAQTPAEAQTPTEAQSLAEAQAPTEVQAPIEAQTPAEAQALTETQAPTEAQTPAEAQAPTEAQISTEDQGSTEAQTSIETPAQLKTVKTLMPPVEYILGIADLTGELMRKCISNLSSGDISSCFQTCNFVRSMYKGFLGCTGVSGREVGRKLFTLRQSLIKMENVCYTIKVRGSEIPKHMLADMASSAAEDMNVEDDEGYQVY